MPPKRIPSARASGFEEFRSAQHTIKTCNKVFQKHSALEPSETPFLRAFALNRRLQP
jgi:hypothetical protein